MMTHPPQINKTLLTTQIRPLTSFEHPSTKVSKGSKFMSALGKFLGPVGFAASLFNPLFAIGGALGVGMTYLGNKQQRQDTSQYANNMAADLQRAGYGPQQNMAAGYDDVAGAGGAQDDVTNILFLRGASDHAMVDNMMEGDL
jgi:hypothetical protein